MASHYDCFVKGPMGRNKTFTIKSNVVRGKGVVSLKDIINYTSREIAEQDCILLLEWLNKRGTVKTFMDAYPIDRERDVLVDAPSVVAEPHDGRESDDGRDSDADEYELIPSRSRARNSCRTAGRA